MVQVCQENKHDGVLRCRCPNRYDPDLLRALGLGSDRPHLNRGLSEDGRQAPGVTPTPDWQDDPDVIHGSLGNPRRRPTVVMGVKGFRPKLSGAAYKHSSSIYASDMDLHRSDAMVTNDVSQAEYEPRDLQSPSVSNQNFPLSGKSPWKDRLRESYLGHEEQAMINLCVLL